MRNGVSLGNILYLNWRNAIRGQTLLHGTIVLQLIGIFIAVHKVFSRDHRVYIVKFYAVVISVPCFICTSRNTVILEVCYQHNG